jgi:hypothetical protein
MFVIYGKNQCQYCEKTKALLTQKGLEFTYLTLDKDFTREELLEMAPEAKSFPQIWREDEGYLFHIGGYDDLVEYLDTAFEEDVVSALNRGGIVSVKFNKSDGSIRTMLCTKNPETIAENYTAPEKKTDRVRKESADVVVVFDLDKNDWRSFRLDSVIEYIVVEEVHD